MVYCLFKQLYPNLAWPKEALFAPLTGCLVPWTPEPITEQVCQGV